MKELIAINIQFYRFRPDVDRHTTYTYYTGYYK